MENLLCNSLITLMFFLSGIDKIVNFYPTVNGFVGKTGVPETLAVIMIAMAALLQICAPVSIIYSTVTGKYVTVAKAACFALALFTVAATLVYHFPPYGRTYYPFISNVTTLGALLLVAKTLEE